MRALVLALALSGCASLSACASSPDGLVAEVDELSPTDGTLTSGEFRDVYAVRARAGQWIKVDVLSSAFHPYLILRTPGGEQADDDGTATGRADRSGLVFQATEAGPYEVSVTSVGVGETGEYVLVYEVLDAPPERAGRRLPPGHPAVPGLAPPTAPRTGPRSAPRVGPPFTEEEIGEGVRI